MRRKENYAMKRLDVPKRVDLPNGRTFFARYKRIKREELPPEIIMWRTYRQRAAPRGRRRRRQQGRGIVEVTKKALKNPMVRAAAKNVLEYAPGIYQNISKRVTNKRIKKILNSDFALLGLNQAIKAGNGLLNVKPKLPSKPKKIGLA